MRQAELFRQNECLADGDHRDAEDHVVADLRGLSGAGFAAMDDAAGHRLRGLARPWRMPPSQPPAMKVSVPAAAPPVPPETGASIDSRPCLAAMACAFRAEFDVDGRGIDEQRAFLRLRRDVLIDRQHMLACRQHGDDDSASFTAAGGVGHHDDAIVPARPSGSPERGRSPSRVPGLDQIGGHRVAHIAEADEGDGRHGDGVSEF